MTLYMEWARLLDQSESLYVCGMGETGGQIRDTLCGMGETGGQIRDTLCGIIETDRPTRDTLCGMGEAG